MSTTFDALANQISPRPPLAPSSGDPKVPTVRSSGVSVRDGNDPVPGATGSSGAGAGAAGAGTAGTAPDLPFGFQTTEAAETEQPPQGGPLPNANQPAATSEESCNQNCQKEQEEREKVCDAMRKRVALWFKENGCPTTVKAYKPTTVNTTSDGCSCCPESCHEETDCASGTKRKRDCRGRFI